MSYITTVKPLVSPVYHLYLALVSLYAQWRAHQRRQKSLRDLNRLDAHLLEDIGLVREAGRVCSIKALPMKRDALYLAEEQRNRKRARGHKSSRSRHPYRRRRKT